MDVNGSTLQVSMLIAKNRQYKITGNQEIIEGFETQEVLGLKLIYHFSDRFSLWSAYLLSITDTLQRGGLSGEKNTALGVGKLCCSRVNLLTGLDPSFCICGDNPGHTNLLREIQGSLVIMHMKSLQLGDLVNTYGVVFCFALIHWEVISLGIPHPQDSYHPLQLLSRTDYNIDVDLGCLTSVQYWGFLSAADLCTDQLVPLEKKQSSSSVSSRRTGLLE